MLVLRAPDLVICSAISSTVYLPLPSAWIASRTAASAEGLGAAGAKGRGAAERGRGLLVAAAGLLALLSPGNRSFARILFRFARTIVLTYAGRWLEVMTRSLFFSSST